MTRNDLSLSIPVPEGVSVSIVDNDVTVKGPKGEVSRTMQSQGINITSKDSAVDFSAKKATQRGKKMFFTFRAHLNNMIKGVQDGFTYKLKVCSGHFPMSVSVKGQELEIKNFIGEKVPRVLRLKDGADVKLNGDIIEVFSVNKETAGQIAGDIEKLTRRPGFDKRKFQDGIYIIEKAG